MREQLREKTSARILKNGAIPILTPPFSHFPQQKTPQRPSIRTPPFLAFALFTPRSLYLCTAPSAPSRLPRLPAFLDSPSVPFDSRPNLPRLSRSTPLVFHVLHAFPWQKTPIGARLQRKRPRLTENAARGPHSTGNMEASRPYRERFSPTKKENRRSENRPSRIAPRLSKSEPRNEAP